jgi:hypothetical protein
MASPYRVYNYTDRELIVATDEAGEQQYRLLGQSVSPLDETPRLLWAASGAAIDGAPRWALDEGFDVHVTEAGLGPGLWVVHHPLAPTEDLHIFGLGIHPVQAGQTLPATEAALAATPATPATRPAWFYHEDETWVTVLGAGITGLTVAHELVTRGFRVQVIERAHGSPADIRDGDPGAATGGDPLIERFRRGLTAPDVGGIARTQWGTQPLARGAAPNLFDAMRRMAPVSPASAAPSPRARGRTRAASSTPREPAKLSSLRSIHGDAVWFGPDRGGPQAMGDYHAFGIRWERGQIEDFAAGLLAWLRERGEARSLAAVQVVIVVYRGDGADRVERAYRRFDELLGVLATMAPAERGDARAELRTTLDRLQVLPTARIDVDDDEPAGATPFVGLYVRVHEDLGLIAGEHGFRFFPAFYRHLRDTMRRTPIFDPLTRTFTPRTAHDNLEEVRWQLVADPERPYRAALSRKPLPTIGGMIEQYRAIRRDLDYRPVDLVRFALRILRYMTSSTRRRRDHYEDMSWWTFLSKPHLDDPAAEPPFDYERRFEEALKHAPKALVAMGSEHADARTQGNINVQLLMDQFELLDQSDSTLAGPTSTSWFNHWRTFLEEQGVRFFLGEVTAIGVDKAGARADTTKHRARVEIAFPGGAAPAEYLDGEEMVKRKRIRAHYIVSALDVAGLARVTRALRRSGDAVGAIEDLDRLVGDDGGEDRDLEDITAIGQTGPDGGVGDRFQTLTGIQLYYQRHVSFANGHIYFAGSPWGLSAISQIQFWGPFGSGHRGRLAGNLSVDIGAWRGGGRGVLDPNALDRDAIAAEVQRQIMASSKTSELEHPEKWTPRASLYHLDDFIAFAREDPARRNSPIRPRRNHAPFLINVTGEWELRPAGTPWTPNDLATRDREPGAGTLAGALWTPSEGGYLVHYGNLVVAGPHMRTFTRMATMEAANESGRHAVNAILDHATWLARRPAAAEMRELERVRIERMQRVQVMARFIRRTDTPSTNVVRSTTPFGDYCDIWDPELFELEDLRFLRTIDEHLMEAGARTDGGGGLRVLGEPEAPAPHLFDILRIDELPDRLLGDDEAERTFELVGRMLAALDEAQLVDLASVFAAVDRARKELDRMIGREPVRPPPDVRVTPRRPGRTSPRSGRVERSPRPPADRAPRPAGGRRPVRRPARRAGSAPRRRGRSSRARRSRARPRRAAPAPPRGGRRAARGTVAPPGSDRARSGRARAPRA